MVQPRAHSMRLREAPNCAKTAVGTPPYSTERETEAEDKARTSSPTSDGKEGLRPASNPRLRRPKSGARAATRRALPARSWNWAGRRSLSLFTFMHWRRKWQPPPVFLPGES